MAVPISQAWTVATYVLKQKLKGRKRFPLVTMLEPLFRCNLACAGCGKIQYPAHILKQELSPEECFRAVEECGRPWSPFPAANLSCIRRSTRSSKAWWRARSTSTCAPMRCCLRKSSHLFKPSKYLSFSVHLDGQREHHDFSVCREGGYDIAVEGIRGRQPRASASPPTPRSSMEPTPTACAPSSTK